MLILTYLWYLWVLRIIHKNLKFDINLYMYVINKYIIKIETKLKKNGIYNPFRENILGYLKNFKEFIYN